MPGFAPDISVFGKVIGGGMPLAAFGGKRDVMEQLAPLGPVYQAGTLSGNPVATACGLATLREIAKPGFFEALSAAPASLVDGLLGAARAAGVPMSGDCEGGMFGFFFAAELPQHYADGDGDRLGPFQPLLPRACSIAASTSRRRSTRPASSARRTAHADIAATRAAAAESLRARPESGTPGDRRCGPGRYASLTIGRCTCTFSASAAPSWAGSPRSRAKPATASPAATPTSIRR